MLLLGELLVVLTFIELLTNHGSGTEVQGMATAANIPKAKKVKYKFWHSAHAHDHDL